MLSQYPTLHYIDSAPVAQRQRARRVLCHELRWAPPQQRATAHLRRGGTPRQGKPRQGSSPSAKRGVSWGVEDGCWYREKSWLWWVELERVVMVGGVNQAFRGILMGISFLIDALQVPAPSNFSACQSIPLNSTELSNEIWKQPPLLGHLG